MHVLVLAMLVCFPPSIPPARERYVPVMCPLSTLRIIDWGKCTRAGDAWHCPNTETEFRTDCLAKEHKGKTFIQLNVDRPTVLIEDTTATHQR